MSAGRFERLTVNGDLLGIPEEKHSRDHDSGCQGNEVKQPKDSGKTKDGDPPLFRFGLHGVLSLGLGYRGRFLLQQGLSRRSRCRPG
jgi:hypothetical protein